MQLITVAIGSRIRYRAGEGEELTGTVYAIDRVKAGTRYTSVYRIAESDDEIAKEMVIECTLPDQLKKDVLLSLLDQDVLDNINRSNHAVLSTANKYGFRPSGRYLGHSNTATAKT